jgi:hypothetical protein
LFFFFFVLVMVGSHVFAQGKPEATTSYLSSQGHLAYCLKWEFPFLPLKHDLPNLHLNS